MKRVTVVTDMSELSQAAVPHGVDLARALRVPLRLIHVKNVWASVPMDIRLRLQAKQVRRDHLMEAVPAQLHGSLLPSLLRDAADTSIALVVARGSGRWWQRLHRSLTARLIELAPVPVLIVGPDSPRIPRDDGTALLPMDFDPVAMAAMPETLELCERLSVEPRLLHVATGEPAHGICEQAQEIGPDLIMMHGHPHHGLKRLFRHGTTWRVVREAQAPVMVLPSTVLHPRAA